MAETSISIDQEQFSCSVCLDMLKDPVTLPCGHCFCMVCINHHWDREQQRRECSCPECRKAFSPRPDLQRNNTLSKVVKKLKDKIQTLSSSVHCFARPGDVECDVCTKKKLKAKESCLVCLASYCETHVKPHHLSPAFKKHKLIKASPNLQEMICSQHYKLIEIYCQTDQSYICCLCMMDQHKGHNTVTAEAERSQKQTQLEEMQRKFQQRILEKQKKLQEQKQAVKSFKNSTNLAANDITELNRSFKKMISELTENVVAQTKSQLSQAGKLIQNLELEITNLTKRSAELEQLSQTEDHVHFLQSFQSVVLRPEMTEVSPSIPVLQPLSFDAMRNSLSDLKKLIEQFCTKEFSKMPHNVGLNPPLVPPLATPTKAVKRRLNLEDGISPKTKLPRDQQMNREELQCHPGQMASSSGRGDTFRPDSDSD